MNLSVVSDRSRLMRSVSEAMVVGGGVKKEYRYKGFVCIYGVLLWIMIMVWNAET